MNDDSITMIDYGGSNLRSVQKAIDAVGGQVVITSDPDIVRRASKLILPGVGAFGAGIDALRARGLDIAAIEAAGQGVPLLGICLGMQFLFEVSEEMGSHSGLGILPGRVVRFPTDWKNGEGRPLKIPHMGWNRIIHDGRHPLLASVPSGAYGYFVHSYYCEPATEDFILARTDYGDWFTSIVGKDRVYGIQFHPEKSQTVGLQILHNYVKMDGR